MQNKIVYLWMLIFTTWLLAACNNKTKDRAANSSGSIVAATKTAPGKNIAENIIIDSSYHIFAMALDSTGLIETLKKPGPFTVFGPVDEAFNKLPEGVFESLMGRRRNDLINILSYHIVAGSLKANELKDGDKLKTLAGEELTVTVRNDKLTVNGTNVIGTDIESSNGIIHMIDGILFPRNQNPAVY